MILRHPWGTPCKMQKPGFWHMLTRIAESGTFCLEHAPKARRGRKKGGRTLLLITARAPARTKGIPLDSHQESWNSIDFCPTWLLLMDFTPILEIARNSALFVKIGISKEYQGLSRNISVPGAVFARVRISLCWSHIVGYCWLYCWLLLVIVGYCWLDCWLGGKSQGAKDNPRPLPPLSGPPRNCYKLP